MPDNELQVNYVDTIGYRVFSDHLSKIPLHSNGHCRVINTISPNSYGITTKDQSFKNALRESDFLVLDGVYFALSSILLQGKNIRANQGPDVFYHFIDRLNREKGKAFFLGSTERTLELMSDRTKREYPNIKVEVYSPPFKPQFTDEDNATMIERINQFNPDILFVGMTCPKQEKWAIEIRPHIKAGLVICIGNVFDWFAGTQKRIHPFWFKIKLGWFIRILVRPEIFKRNIRNQMIFFWHVLLIFLKLKKYD